MRVVFGGRFSHDSRSWGLKCKNPVDELLQLASNGSLNFQLNSTKVSHEIKGSGSEDLKRNLLPSSFGRNGHIQTTGDLALLCWSGAGPFVCLALQLLGLLFTSLPWLLLNVKP